MMGFLDESVSSCVISSVLLLLLSVLLSMSICLWNSVCWVLGLNWGMGLFLFMFLVFVVVCWLGMDFVVGGFVVSGVFL